MSKGRVFSVGSLITVAVAVLLIAARMSPTGSSVYHDATPHPLVALILVFSSVISIVLAIMGVVVEKRGDKFLNIVLAIVVIILAAFCLLLSDFFANPRVLFNAVG